MLKNVKISKIIFLFIILIFIDSCRLKPDFDPGMCIEAKDGFIWKISRIEGPEYILQGWFGYWGNETKLSGHVISKNIGHIEVECSRVR